MLNGHGFRFGAIALVATVSIVACGSDGKSDPHVDGGQVGPSASDSGPFDAGSVLESGTEGGTEGGMSTRGPDVPPVAFPTTVPMIFGYALQDAFPGTFLSGAMDMQWPAGATLPFVLQRDGSIIRPHTDGTRELLIDFSAEVVMQEEAGALGMALHPKFADPVAPKPYAYVWYNAAGMPTHQRLSRFTWNPATSVFDPASELVMVEQTEATLEHNGARIRFGPDGYLYFGNGDDTFPAVNAQTLSGGLFSGIFRIDVDMIGGTTSHAPPKTPLNATTQGYFIPNDNPFVGVAGAAEEYFALGFRNPYGFNFDRSTGDIWLGDVGETQRESIDHIVSGANFRWPFYEGKKQQEPGAPTIGIAHAPLYDYTHASMADLTATMCGFIYRGTALPELAGKLVYSDWPTGRVWSLDTTTAVRTSLVESNWQNATVGWGQDAQGELYVIAWSKILKLVRAPPHGVPTKLSATGIFRDLSTLEVPSSITPYSIRSPLWSDGAAKQRWVYVPAGNTASMNAAGDITLPPGSMLIKQFDLPATAQPVGRSKRLETRALVVGTDTTYGVTYRWNPQGTDADLLIQPVDENIADADPTLARAWHFPSFGECWSCHRAENRVLGFRGEQLHFALPGGDDQLSVMVAKNVLDAASAALAPAPLASPSDTTATILDRANAYIAANCSPCHHPGASYLGDGETWNAQPGVATADRGLVNAPNHNPAMATGLGLPGAPLIVPGDPMGSILWGRINATDPDLRMPPIQRTQVDPTGVSVISAWISAGPP
jgi:glucose/arabinose dehydrogenase